MPRPTWIPALLSAMGWPDDPASSLGLDTWSLSEDVSYRMQNTCHNYIAIIWPEGQRAPWNSFKCGTGICHVQCYGSEAQGVEATKRFLEQDIFRYVDQAFLAPYWRGKLENIFLAINGSDACSHCQGGKYPQVLYNYLHRRERSLPSPYLITPAPPPTGKQRVSIFTAWHDLTLQLRNTVPKEMRRVENARKRILRSVDVRSPSQRRPKGG